MLGQVKAFYVEASELRAPLVIGVTGHRDLRDQDREALCQQVRSVFLKLKESYRSTPLILLSPLAEGADRLAAHIALEPDIGARLIVPLPMPKRLYEEDFQTADSRTEFNELLQRAERWFELPLCAGNTEEGLRQPDQRDRQYQEVGQFIARESQVMIALWDGVETDLAGGTAQVVRFTTEGVPSQVGCDIEPVEGFLVHHILTPRVKNPQPAGVPLSMRTKYPEVFKGDQTRAENYYAEMFGRLDAFNRLASQPDRALLEQVKASKGYLFPDLNEEELPPRQKVTLNRYAVADALAVRFQQQTIQTQRILHWCVFLSFLCFVFYAHLPGHWRFWLIFSLAFLLSAVWQYCTAKNVGMHTSHEDYRALAEGLRVNLFWGLACVEDRVIAYYAYYLGKQRTELDWIRNALRGWYVEAVGSSVPDGNTGEWDGIRLALLYWVKGQRKYFANAAKRDKSKSERLEHQVRLALGAAVSLTVLLVTTLFTAWGARLVESEWLLAMLLIIVEAMLAAGALLHHYNEWMAYSEHAKQYSRMEGVFSHASELVSQSLQSKDPQRARECLRALGKEALAENGDWVLLHRERPLEMPHP